MELIATRAVEFKTVDIFKAEIDKFLIRTGVKGYWEKAEKWYKEAEISCD